MIQQKIAKCPKCDGTDLTFSALQDKFICKECGYVGEKIKESSKLEEEKKVLMDIVFSSKTRNEIQRAIKKREDMQRKWVIAIGAEEECIRVRGFVLIVDLMHTDMDTGQTFLEF